MSKAPLIVESKLAGEIGVNVCGDVNGAYAKIHGFHTVKVTAKHLRELADELDRMEQAAAVFYDVNSTEYAITFKTLAGNEDSVLVNAIDGQNAADKFVLMQAAIPRENIHSVYDRSKHEYVEF